MTGVPGWDRPVTSVPPAERVIVVCRHGGAGRPHEVDAFDWQGGFDRPAWAGWCGVVAPAVSALGPELSERDARDPMAVADRSRLFFRQMGELPDWRGRCLRCSRAPRDARRRRTVNGQREMPGAGLVMLLDGASAGWLESIDLFDLANHGGRGTLDAIAAAQARVAASLADEQELR